eukprot:TRINITY_DN6766_c0_g2_i1.p1 TRINITY_DN6766_c0_g2~~TRINITY_DN6766_c0_g2_i1.p1  ORF type:complete len:397 (-),score=78.04 TRINITY_DN6766_c0_g2_i1:50-1240(-)
MGHRYLEVYVSSRSEFLKVCDRVLPKDSIPGINPQNVVIRVRGIPYGSDEFTIRGFFDRVKLLEVYIPREDGNRIRGDAYIVVEDDQAADIAMSYHRQYMGKRYVELIRSTHQELDLARSFNPPPRSPTRRLAPPPPSLHHSGRCLMMQGLPFETSDREIMDFFQRVRVTPPRLLIAKRGGRAYVSFDYIEDYEAALTLHRVILFLTVRLSHVSLQQYIGRRYVELIPITDDEFYDKEIEILGVSSRGRVPPLPQQGYGAGYPPYHHPVRAPPDAYYASNYPPVQRYDSNYSSRPPVPHPQDYESRPSPVRPLPSGPATHFLRLSGLPFSASNADISKFFKGFEFDPKSIQMGSDGSGTFDGTAVVGFYDDHSRQRALQERDMKLIGDNCIRLFPE